jgi:hypothetical protein
MQEHPLILEYQLLNSEPEFIYEWYKNIPSEERKELSHKNEFKNLEIRLLEKNKPLITLALAKFCISEEVLPILFEKFSQNGDSAIKLACLSYSPIDDGDFLAPPTCLFPDRGAETKDNIIKWLQKSNYDEIEVLFANDNIDKSFLYDFLKGTDYWNAVNDSLKRAAVSSLKANSHMCSFDYEYAFDDDLLDLAWRLAEKVEVNREWAFVLRDLYYSMKYVPYGIKQDIVDRWRDDRKEEVDSNGFLTSPFAELRSYLYRSHVKYEHSKIDLQHPDVAYRKAVYSFAHLEPKIILEGYEKDLNMAARGMLWNESVWRHEDNREAFSEICRKSSGETIPFSIVNDVFINEHPEWFNNDKNPDNEPLTVGKMRDLLEAFKDQTVRETRSEVLDLLKSYN